MNMNLNRFNYEERCEGAYLHHQPLYTFRKAAQICSPKKNTRAAQIEELSVANREYLTFGSLASIDHNLVDISRMVKLVAIENLRTQLSIGANFTVVRPISERVWSI